MQPRQFKSTSPKTISFFETPSHTQVLMTCPLWFSGMRDKKFFIYELGSMSRHTDRLQSLDRIVPSLSYSP